MKPSPLASVEPNAVPLLEITDIPGVLQGLLAVEASGYVPAHVEAINDGKRPAPYTADYDTFAVLPHI